MSVCPYIKIDLLGFIFTFLIKCVNFLKIKIFREILSILDIADSFLISFGKKGGDGVKPDKSLEMPLFVIWLL